MNYEILITYKENVEVTSVLTNEKSIYSGYFAKITYGNKYVSIPVGKDEIDINMFNDALSYLPELKYQSK